MQGENLLTTSYEYKQGFMRVNKGNSTLTFVNMTLMVKILSKDKSHRKLHTTTSFTEAVL